MKKMAYRQSRASTGTTSMFLEDLGLISQDHIVKVIDLVKKMGLGPTTPNLCSFIAGELTKIVITLLKALVPSTPIWGIQNPSDSVLSPVPLGFQPCLSH